MSLITRQDTNGVKPLLQTGEFGYDNYPAGGDNGRVYVGTGSENVPLAKKAEMLAVDGKADVHIARVDNPHEVTKEQVGLGNVENLAPADMPISSAGHAALNAKANKTDADLLGVPKAPTAAVGTNSTQLATTAFVGAEIADKSYSKTQLDAGQLDNRYYTETELDNGALDSRYYTETELLNGALDVRYYTETEIDAKLDAQNEASEISYDNTVSGIVATNVQDAVDEIKDSVDILDSTVVKLTGDQTIEDVKTFMSSPIVPTPTAVNQAVNKQYVDNMVISPNGSNSYAVAMAIVFGS